MRSVLRASQGISSECFSGIWSDYYSICMCFFFFRFLPLCFCGLLQTKLCMLRCIYPFQKPLLGKENSQHFCVWNSYVVPGQIRGKNNFLLKVVGFVCDWLHWLDSVHFSPLICCYFSFVYSHFYRKCQFNLRQDPWWKDRSFGTFSFDNSSFHAVQNSFGEMKNNLVNNRHI